MILELFVKNDLDKNQLALLDNHSFLNVMNILIGEIQYIELEIEDYDILKPAKELCYNIKDELMDSQLALQRAKQYQVNRNEIEKSIKRVFEKYPQYEKNDILKQDVENIISVLNILAVRANEIVERATDPDKWLIFKTDYLLKDFTNFFNAVEKNSKGRYHIVKNIANQEEKDYLVYLNFDGDENGEIKLPMIFKDVMRDLVANARKYTKPGGTIEMGLSAKNGKLFFVVKDNGMGIPEADLPFVANFGFRASNTTEIPTKGGGFGLTKALNITKGFNGNMWIDSTLNKGTTIKIELPLPN